jgi:uncharacterized protein
LKINIKEVISGQKSSINFETSEKVTNTHNFGDEVTLITPITLKAEVTKIDHKLFINGRVEGIAEFTCSRCLKRFQKEIKEKVYGQLIVDEDEQEEMDEFYYIVEDTIDTSEITHDVLVTSFPMKILCDENCKGLCSVCGKDLSVDKCNCNIEEIDPRLAKLKDLLQQD